MQIKKPLLVGSVCLLLFLALFVSLPLLGNRILPKSYATTGPITRTATAQKVSETFSNFNSWVNCCEFPALGMTITTQTNGVNWVSATSYGSGAAFHGPGKNQTLSSSLSGDFTVQAVLNVTATANDLARVGVFLFNSSGFTYFFGWVQYTTTGGNPQYSYFYGENAGSSDYAGDPGSNATWNTPYGQKGELSSNRVFGNYENMEIQRVGTILEWRVNGTEISSHVTTKSTQTGVAFVIQQFATSTPNPNTIITDLGVSNSAANVTVTGVTKAITVSAKIASPFPTTDLLPSLTASNSGLSAITTAEADLASVNIAGDIVSIGGFTGGTPTSVSNKVQLYTPNNNTWSQLATYPVGRWGMVCADPTNSISDKIYCFAGTDGTSSPPPASYKYNFQTNAWSAITASFPSTNLTGFFGSDIAGDPDNGAIYLGGCSGSGLNTNVCIQTIWYVYTPGNNTFKALANIPTGTNYGGGPAGPAYGTAFYRSGNVYLIAGGNSSSHTLSNSILKYNIAANTWSQVCNLCFSTIYPFAGFSNGELGAQTNTANSTQLYPVVGGEDNVGSGVYSVLAFYDPVNQVVTKDLNASLVPCALEAFGVYTNSDIYYSSCTGTSGTQSNTATTSTYKLHFNFATLIVPAQTYVGTVNFTTTSNGVSQGSNTFSLIMSGDQFTYSFTPAATTATLNNPTALTLTVTTSGGSSFQGNNQTFTCKLNTFATAYTLQGNPINFQVNLTSTNSTILGFNIGFDVWSNQTIAPGYSLVGSNPIVSWSLNTPGKNLVDVYKPPGYTLQALTVAANGGSYIPLSNFTSAPPPSGSGLVYTASVSSAESWQAQFASTNSNGQGSGQGAGNPTTQGPTTQQGTTQGGTATSTGNPQYLTSQYTSTYTTIQANGLTATVVTTGQVIYPNPNYQNPNTPIINQFTNSTTIGNVAVPSSPLGIAIILILVIIIATLVIGVFRRKGKSSATVNLDRLNV